MSVGWRARSGEFVQARSHCAVTGPCNAPTRAACAAGGTSRPGQPFFRWSPPTRAPPPPRAGGGGGGPPPPPRHFFLSGPPPPPAPGARAGLAVPQAQQVPGDVRPGRAVRRLLLLDVGQHLLLDAQPPVVVGHRRGAITPEARIPV